MAALAVLLDKEKRLQLAARLRACTSVMPVSKLGGDESFPGHTRRRWQRPGRWVVPSTSLSSTRSAARLLHEALRHFPADWIGAVKTDPIAIVVAPDGASYGEGKISGRAASFAGPLIVLDSRVSRRHLRGMAIHELAHHFAMRSAQIIDVERDFIELRRERGADGAPASAVPDEEYPEIKLVPGSFVNGYFGAIHPEIGGHDVLTCGAEALFAGQYGGLIGSDSYESDDQLRAPSCRSSAITRLLEGVETLRTLEGASRGHSDIVSEVETSRTRGCIFAQTHQIFRSRETRSVASDLSPLCRTVRAPG
ncbi:hypothetical protein [Salinibacterium sp. ZJ450]|uniref:hypothetical protein n=1 Tax=Salinibacterium sp. ZJ450 TaxID=2708338 RepID=UPI001421C03A|nr:hypothetical protein [Salinibacterium sp. ZJ450]